MTLPYNVPPQRREISRRCFFVSCIVSIDFMKNFLYNGFDMAAIF